MESRIIARQLCYYQGLEDDQINDAIIEEKIQTTPNLLLALDISQYMAQEAQKQKIIMKKILLKCKMEEKHS